MAKSKRAAVLCEVKSLRRVVDDAPGESSRVKAKGAGVPGQVFGMRIDEGGDLAMLVAFKGSRGAVEVTLGVDVVFAR